MMTSQSSPHTPCEDSQATDRSECAHDINRPHRAVPNSGSHHAERDGYFGQEPPLTVGNDTFYVDLLFFHRRRFSPLAPALRGEGPGVRGSSPIDLKNGKFKPNHAGKSRFYRAALDEQLRLPHENPSIGLVLCKSANKVQVRLAPTAAAVKKTGVATYQPTLPDERLIQRRLQQLPNPSETDDTG